MFTNKTANYNLPQYLGTDKAEWLDNNAAFATIDTALKEAALNAESAGSNATTAATAAAQAKSAADNAQATATRAQSTADTNASNIAGLNTRVAQVETGVANNSRALGGFSFVALTQTQYDALETKDPNTVYLVKAGE